MFFTLGLFALVTKITFNMGNNNVSNHSITDSWSSYLVLSSILLSILNWNTQPLCDSNSNRMAVFLQSQDEDVDLNKYRSKVSKTQIKHSQFVVNAINEETAVDQHGDIQVPMPRDGL